MSSRERLLWLRCSDPGYFGRECDVVWSTGAFPFQREVHCPNFQLQLSQGPRLRRGRSWWRGIYQLFLDFGGHPGLVESPRARRGRVRAREGVRRGRGLLLLEAARRQALGARRAAAADSREGAAPGAVDGAVGGRRGAWYGRRRDGVRRRQRWHDGLGLRDEREHARRELPVRENQREFPAGESAGDELEPRGHLDSVVDVAVVVNVAAVWRCYLKRNMVSINATSAKYSNPRGQECGPKPTFPRTPNTPKFFMDDPQSSVTRSQ